MDTRNIGTLDVSVVGLGCNNFGGRIDADQTQAVVDAALEQGITYFDTAELYTDGRSEELLGRALGSRRDEVVIATKWGHTSDIEEGGVRLCFNMPIIFPAMVPQPGMTMSLSLALIQAVSYTHLTLPTTPYV